MLDEIIRYTCSFIGCLFLFIWTKKTTTKNITKKFTEKYNKQIEYVNELNFIEKRISDCSRFIIIELINFKGEESDFKKININLLELQFYFKRYENSILKFMDDQIKAGRNGKDNA